MGALKPWHIIVLVVVLILLFGAKRLPDAARSLGRSLRIIKAETKGLRRRRRRRQGGGPVGSRAAAGTIDDNRPSPRADRGPGATASTSAEALDRRERPRRAAPEQGADAVPTRRRRLDDPHGAPAGAAQPPVQGVPRAGLRLRHRLLALRPVPCILVEQPVCDFMQGPTAASAFVQLGVADFFLLELKVALWIGPDHRRSRCGCTSCGRSSRPGLHRHERKYAYMFVAIAAPLFALGAFLACFVVGHEPAVPAQH